METVHVPLPGREYDVRIGVDLLRRAGSEIAPLLAKPEVAIVTDETVAALHLGALQEAVECGSNHGGDRQQTLL